jgi:hypothetical protein
MRDSVIRASLKQWVNCANPCTSDLLIADEVELCGGEARADVVVFSGAICGYEIKSACDSLSRLANQASAYSRSFELATLVLAETHLDSALGVIPEWWGVLAAVSNGEEVTITQFRPPHPNPSLDLYSVACFLWKSEALDILGELGLGAGLRNKPMRDILSVMANKMPAKLLCSYVRSAIRSRQGWKSAGRTKQRGGRYRLSPKSVHRSLPYPSLQALSVGLPN